MRVSRLALRVIGLAVVLVLLSPPTFGQKCGKRTALAADTDVFEKPPSYVTGAGWRGNIQEHLSAGTAVFVCREVSLDFGFSSMPWVQIAYRSGQQWPKYGWVIKQAVRASSGMAPNYGVVGVLITTANAATTPSEEPANDQLADAAPEVPPLVPGAAGGAIAGSMSAGTSDLFSLYLPLFVAMVLGMGAKVLVDLLDSWDKGLAWAHLRNGVVAILVSPIVFLGMLSAGQFSVGAQTFIVLALLAFQNGFFWQTVLKRESDRTAVKGRA